MIGFVAYRKYINHQFGDLLDDVRSTVRPKRSEISGTKVPIAMKKAKLGQNFLVDEGWQKKIVSYFEPSASFGEIGPGYGALTKHIEKKYSDFVVFEIDPEIIEAHKNKNYSIIEGSFLDWDFCLNGGAGKSVLSHRQPPL